LKEKDILTLNAIVEEMRTRPTDEVHELEKKCAEVWIYTMFRPD